MIVRQVHLKYQIHKPDVYDQDAFQVLNFLDAGHQWIQACLPIYVCLAQCSMTVFMVVDGAGVMGLQYSRGNLRLDPPGMDPCWCMEAFMPCICACLLHAMYHY